MSNFILIDTTSLEVIAKTETEEQAHYIRSLRCPGSDYYLAGDGDKEGKLLSVFTRNELTFLSFSLFNQVVPDNVQYGTLLKTIFNSLVEMPISAPIVPEDFAIIDEEGTYTPKVSFPANTIDNTAKEKSTPKKEKAASTGNIPNRPKSGTLTGTCWEVYDLLSETHTLDRAAFIAAAMQKGVQKSTASTQFSRWSANRAAS